MVRYRGTDGDVLRMDITEQDELDAHCRTLGHSVPFRYCRTVAQGLPCYRVIDCWLGRFDVASFVQEHYTEEQIQRIHEPPKSKLASIVELIERAKRSGNPPQA